MWPLDWLVWAAMDWVWYGLAVVWVGLAMGWPQVGHELVMGWQWDVLAMGCSDHWQGRLCVGWPWDCNGLGCAGHLFG